MVLIAVFALYLGWEIHAWRAFGVSARYRRLAAEYAATEADCRLALARTKIELAKLESGPPLKLPDESRTPAAQAAVRSYLADRFRRAVATSEALCEDYARLKRKYERAASAPGSPVGPDPPLQEGQSSENVEWPNWRNFLRANVDYGALIRRYPDLYWAHERQAWILATSPDPSYRDGPRAVAAALRAAELTKWNDAHVLSTLAAAYAEAGDFAKAVISQQRALAAPPAASSVNVFDLQSQLKVSKNRLALYQSGKPFRLAP
jgi:tetratricopeptide (TPR) repeat protein